MKLTWFGIVILLILILFIWMGYRRGFIREIVSFFFVFLSLSLAWAINPYINDFLISETPVYSTIQETCTDFVQKQSSDLENEMESSSQFIDGLNLPEILRKNIEKNNNTENYAELSVNTLTEYVSRAFLCAGIYIGNHWNQDSGLYTESDRRTPDSENGK